MKRGQGTCPASLGQGERLLGRTTTLCLYDTGLSFPCGSGRAKSGLNGNHHISSKCRFMGQNQVRASQVVPGPPYLGFLPMFQASLVYCNFFTSMQMFSSTFSSKHTLNVHSLGLYEI